MKLIIPYTNPDLDGVACAIGYEEYFTNKSIRSKAAIFGEPHSEAQFVLRQNSIPQPENAQNLIQFADEVILVDASDKRGISKSIDITKIIEVIDHRSHYEKSDFPNAKFQIELVGAAATLIAEKFFAEDISFSKDTGLLLYSAIISNTINFKASVTTKRDILACSRIEEHIRIPDDWIERMFQYKSSNIELTYDSFMENLTGFFFLNSRHLIVTQIEIIDIEDFINKNRSKLIEIFEEMKSKYPTHLCLFNFIDIKNGYNIFFSLDKEIMELLSNYFHVIFTNYFAIYSKVIMRKEIIPILNSIF